MVSENFNVSHHIKQKYLLVSDEVVHSLMLEYKKTMGNLQRSAHQILFPYTIVYVSLGLIGNILMIAVLKCHKPFRNLLFYRLQVLNCHLGNLVLLGQLFLYGYNTNLWCERYRLNDHSYRYECGRNFASWIALLLWKPLSYGATEIYSVLSLFIGLESVVSLYHKAWYRKKLSRNQRCYWSICGILALLYVGLYWPHIARHSPEISSTNGS